MEGDHGEMEGISAAEERRGERELREGARRERELREGEAAASGACCAP